MATLGCFELFASHHSTFIAPRPMIAWIMCSVLLTKVTFPQTTAEES